jgi:Holliday junction resolvasome RuvABC endonuclease subunit
MAEYIYGLDLSMSNTGVAIFDLQGNFVKVCSVATKDKDSHGKRLKVIADFLLELKEIYPAKVVVIERAFSRFNTSTAVIYRVHGVVQYLFYDILQIYYPPKLIKAELLGGKSTKKQIQDEIIKQYPDIKFDNEDESDAMSVALTYFSRKNKGLEVKCP